MVCCFHAVTRKNLSPKSEPAEMHTEIPLLDSRLPFVLGTLCFHIKQISENYAPEPMLIHSFIQLVDHSINKYYLSMFYMLGIFWDSFPLLSL